MTHAAYFLAAILGLTWFVALALSFWYLDALPLQVWFAGFCVWLGLLFLGRKSNG